MFSLNQRAGCKKTTSTAKPIFNRATFLPAKSVTASRPQRTGMLSAENTQKLQPDVKSIDASSKNLSTDKLLCKPLECSVTSKITTATCGEKLSVRFSDDLAAQLLCGGCGGVGPGNFLSRSQDNLTSAAAGARRRKPATVPVVPSTNATVGARRQASSCFGSPKSGHNAGRTGPRGSVPSAQLASALGVNGVRKGSLPNGDAAKTLQTLSATVANAGKCAPSNVPFSTNVNRKSPAASQQVADARITKTKLTVTELQKHKQELECQVSELVQKAEQKQAELATLKMEIRHLKEERDKELDNLRSENERLRYRLRDSTGSVEDVIPKGKIVSIDAATSPSSSAGEPVITESVDANDIFCGTGGAENMGNGPCGDGGVPSSTRATTDWDRQSTSSMSEVSLACLQDRIVQMEETHYSTNEELQATLQELTDLQDIVNELSKENTQLTEEKSMLLDSLYNQTQKLNNCRLQIENLKHLLLSSTDLRFSSARGSTARATSNGAPASGAVVNTNDDQQQPIEREQQLVDLLKNTQEEHEELACKYDEIRNALKLANEEKMERVELMEILRDRARLLENQIDGLTNDRRGLEDQVRECKQQIDRDKREIVRITNVYEKERCRVEELLRQSNVAGNKDEMRNMLEKLRAEKVSAEDRVNALEEALTKKTHEIDDLRHVCDALQAELRCARSETEKTVMALEDRVQELEHENEHHKKQVVELRANVLELEERCQRHTDDKKEFRANIITLQKTVDDVTSERERLKRELIDEQALREQDSDEWRQFQADLQVAVVVANDFKMEAQNDIERLATENSQLRDRMSTLSMELDKLRSNRMSPTSKINAKCPPLSTTLSSIVPPCPDLRTRMEGYLTSVEKNGGVSTATSLTASLEGTRAKKYSNASEQMKGLSVRALVESLENAGTQPTSMNFRTTAPMLRSPGSNRHSSVSSSTASGNSGASPEMDSPLSKSSGHLASRPISVDGVEGLLSKQTIKNAASETEMQALAPAVLRGSPIKKSSNPAPVPDVVMNAQATAVDVAAVVPPKPTRGILLSRPAPPPTSRLSGAYLHADTKDPLGKLMKDAPRGSRRNALLRWCQNRIVGYNGVEITNFSSSWNDGLAFCALLHSFAPNKIPYKTLDAKDKRRNFTIAFQTAEKLGIPAALNVDEMLSLERPDWQSVMSYVTSIYKHFER